MLLSQVAENPTPTFLKVMFLPLVKAYLSCRDAHRQALDSIDFLLEVLVDLRELVDLQYIRAGSATGHPLVLRGHILVLILRSHQRYRVSAANEVTAKRKVVAEVNMIDFDSFFF